MAVKVLDFGVAKLLPVSGSSSDAIVTEVGSWLGTPCYMAPEQVLGLPTVDERADFWAIGVLLFEMLAGCRPVEGNSSQEVAQRTLTVGIPPLARLAPDVPAELCALVDQLLARKVEHRPRRLAAVAGVLARVVEPARSS